MKLRQMEKNALPQQCITSTNTATNLMLSYFQVKNSQQLLYEILFHDLKLTEKNKIAANFQQTVTTT